ncbi:MAG: GYDIA family GHMP kinase [Polaribacter sp.]
MTLPKNFYSNGKLLLTGEYLVLDGATSLAVPTKFGQDLVVESIKEPQLIWGSFTNTGDCWFEAVFDLPKLRLVSCTFNSEKEGNAKFLSADREDIAETLLEILQEAKKLSRNLGTNFLNTENGFIVKTKLTFPRNWGLGSSSTLINNIASWANIDAYQLLWNSFQGSGYDIACAQNNSPILYQLKNKKPIVEQVEFRPNFKENLFFVHLNKKQNSKEGIATYKAQHNKFSEIDTVSNLSEEFIKANSLKDLEKIIVEHEQIISSIIKQKTVKENLFSDYFGEVKSLGAWGGDFVLATGNENTPKYFKQKGFETVLSYTAMVL